MLELLSREETEKIHNSSLNILKDVGIKVYDENICSLLKKAGALVDEGNGVVRLRKEQVIEALQSVPKEVKLYSRDGKVLSLGKEEHYHFSGADTLYFFDYGSSQPRKSTKEDVANFAKIADCLSEIDGLAPQVYAEDYSSRERELHTMEALVLNTVKHCLIAPLKSETVKIWVEIGEIFLESREDFSTKPIFSIVVSTTSPLQFDKESVNALMYGVKKGLPVILLTVPAGGVTAPFSLTGSLIIQNAENLFAFTLSQIIKPGAGFIYGGASTIMDMKEGDMVFGSPEYALLCGATAQLARFYKIPSYSPISQTDAKLIDVQNGIEKMANYLIAINSGLDITLGAGAFRKATASSYEQMVIDNEMLRWVRRLDKGINVDEIDCLTKTIKESGIGGSFLAVQHTIDNLRSGEYLFSSLFDRNGTKTDIKGMYERSHEEVKKILNEHQVIIDESKKDEVRRYIAKKTKELE